MTEIMALFSERAADKLSRDETYGEILGAMMEARKLTLRMLYLRFGEVPEAIRMIVESADREWCEDLAERILGARTLEDLELS